MTPHRPVRCRPASIAFMIFWILSSCEKPNRRDDSPAATAPPPRDAETVPFVERAAAAGIDFVHHNGMVGDFHIAELMGSGAALFDADNDGDLDVYLVQGSAFDPASGDPRPVDGQGDRLYRNNSNGGELHFDDITAASGLAATGYGMGVATGDYDHDGRVDLYVTNFGPNQLWRNLGNDHDGVPMFRDVTTETGAGDDRWSVPATFLDYDRDGWLDLFIGNYLGGPFVDGQRCAHPSGWRDYCGASQFVGVTDRLLHNRGDGTFEDVTTAAGLAAVRDPGRALGALAADLDSDGWQDLYVGNDAGPNHLWRSLGDGTFSDVALLSGTAVNGSGQAEATMGIDAADDDGDGDLDLFLTHLIVETNTLYRNRGASSGALVLFDDRSSASGLGPPSRVHTAFGTAFLDYDGDGRRDLFVANGAVQTLETLVHRRDPLPFHEPNQLFRGRGPSAQHEARYEEISSAAGEAFTLSEVSRGAAFGDVDNDGDVDVLVVNNNGPARLLINQVGHHRPWIGLRLLTGDPPRDALGAMVALRIDGRLVSWDRVAADGSYASASDPRVLFSLAESSRVEGIQVRWPDGSVDEWPPVPTGCYTEFRQGEGPSAPTK